MEPLEPSPPPAGFRIRIAVPDDYAAVSRLFSSSYAKLMRPVYEGAAFEAALPLLTRANPMLLAAGTFFVSETPDGTVAACGGWTRQRPGAGDTTTGLGHIRHFATHPGHVRRGLGRSLFAACAQQARSNSIDRFECYASLNAETFYAALGFEVIKRVEIALGKQIWLPAVWMRCSL